MGLERQPEMQSSILSRFHSHDLAACFLSIASTELKMGYTTEACTCVVSEAASKHGTPATILKAWHAKIKKQKLQQAYAMLFEEGKSVIISNPSNVCTVVKAYAEAASKHDTPATILTTWQAKIEEQKLQQAHAMQFEQGKRITVSDWSDVCTVVEASVGTTFRGATNTIRVALQSHRAAVAPPSHNGVEPVLQYTWETCHRSQRPPALIGDDLRLWAGRLYIGSMSPVLSKEWMTQCGDNEGRWETPENEAAEQARLPHVAYSNFPDKHSVDICPLGFHAEAYVDRLARNLRSKLGIRSPKTFGEIKILEKCLAYMIAMRKVFNTATAEEIEAYVCICRDLCTAHHIRMHRSYYKKLRKQQINILQDMCVLRSTVSYAHKLGDQGSGWSRSVRALNTVIGAIDEVQVVHFFVCSTSLTTGWLFRF